MNRTVVLTYARMSLSVCLYAQLVFYNYIKAKYLVFLAEFILNIFVENLCLLCNL